MAEAIGWAITALVVALVAAFAVYLVAVARLPNERPKVLTYDRRGRVIGRYENPGEQIAPDRAGDPPLQHGDQDGPVENGPAQNDPAEDGPVE